MEGSGRRTQRAWVRPFGPCYFAARLTFVLLLPGNRVKAPALRGFSPEHCTPTDEDGVSLSLHGLFRKRTSASDLIRGTLIGATAEKVQAPNVGTAPRNHTGVICQTADKYATMRAKWPSSSCRTPASPDL